jgi:hypothetical protein
MAKMIVCDGCGLGVIGPEERIGFVIRRDYCTSCASVVGAYGAEVDALHDRLAKAWNEDLILIREKYRAKLKHLPDDNTTVRDDEPA